MKGRPWYKRYPADILQGTMALNVAEKGAYNVVLDLMYDRGGPIPDDPRWLARQCGCSMQQWRSLRDSLIAHGKLGVTSDGRLSNDRAIEEMTQNEAEAEALRKAGKRGGLARNRDISAKKERETYDEVKETNGQAGNGLTESHRHNPCPPETLNQPEVSTLSVENINLLGTKQADNNGLAFNRLEAVPDTRLLDRKKESKTSSLRSDSSDLVRGPCPPLPGQEPNGFARWYHRYPRKDGRLDACRAYEKARRIASEEEIFNGLLTYEFSPDRHYQPMAATWLNKGRWQHDPDTAPPSVAASPPDRRMEGIRLVMRHAAACRPAEDVFDLHPGEWNDDDGK